MHSGPSGPARHPGPHHTQQLLDTTWHRQQLLQKGPWASQTQCPPQSSVPRVAEHRQTWLLQDLRLSERDGEDKPLNLQEEILLFCCCGKSANIWAKKPGALHGPQRGTASSVRPTSRRRRRRRTRREVWLKSPIKKLHRQMASPTSLTAGGRTKKHHKKSESWLEICLHIFQIGI